MGTAPPGPPRVKPLLAFAAIYVLWGSTYLAIRLAVETLPPFLMAGSRFLVAGAARYALGSRSGTPRPTRRQWRNAAVGSVPLFVVGNGGVTGFAVSPSAPRTTAVSANRFSARHVSNPRRLRT